MVEAAGEEAELGGKLIVGDFETTLDIPVEGVCESAKEWEEVLIIGTKGDELMAGSSVGDRERLLWMAMQFVRNLLSGRY